MKKLVVLLALVGCKSEPAAKPKEVHLFLWAEYIGKEVMDAFEKKTGTRVVEITYTSEEEGFAKVKQPGAHYDLMVVSNELLPQMIRENLISPIQTPNIKNLDPRFDRPSYSAAHDAQGRRVALPYMWGTLGICYDSDKVKVAEPSWALLWDEKYKGKICMFDQMVQTIAVGLAYTGHGINADDEKSLADAQAALKKQFPLVVYKDDQYRAALKQGDVWISMAWNGDAAKEAKEKPSLRYAVPKEGSSMWVDNLVLLAKPCNPEGALAFLDYIMDPEVNARISEYVAYATCNKEARAHLSKEMLQDPAIYPGEEVLKRCEFRKDPGGNLAKFKKIWDAVKGN